MLKENPLVSILINNYNYGNFLREAIDSSLSQTYPFSEVIVVDDGSTDNSIEIITSYKDQIVPVFKKNGGQASAFNAGFELAKGDIVIFLDSDDVLLPDIVQRVVSAFKSSSDVVKVQYRMQVVDVNGKATGEVMPPSSCIMPNGDLKTHILEFPDYPWPPTSGNAFLATILRKILPMPEDVYRISADHYLNWLSIVFGSIASIDEVGALYRVHGKNNFRTNRINLVKLRQSVIVAAEVHAKRRELLKALYSVDVLKAESRDLFFLINRIILLKLDPQNYPFKDSLSSLCFKGFIFSIAYLNYHWSRKFFLALWFASILFAPKTIAQSIAEIIHAGNNGHHLINNLLAVLKKFGRRRALFVGARR
jgi:glycosyltransferase involved in cell wall biosynthesis